MKRIMQFIIVCVVLVITSYAVIFPMTASKDVSADTDDQTISLERCISVDDSKMLKGSFNHGVIVGDDGYLDFSTQIEISHDRQIHVTTTYNPQNSSLPSSNNNSWDYCLYELGFVNPDVKVLKTSENDNEFLHIKILGDKYNSVKASNIISVESFSLDATNNAKSISMSDYEPNNTDVYIGNCVSIPNDSLLYYANIDVMAIDYYFYISNAEISDKILNQNYLMCFLGNPDTMGYLSSKCIKIKLSYYEWLMDSVMTQTTETSNLNDPALLKQIDDLKTEIESLKQENMRLKSENYDLLTRKPNPDYDGDGFVTVSDAVKLLRYIAGME